MSDSHPLLDGMLETLSQCDGDLEEQSRRALLYIAFVLDDATHQDHAKEVPEMFLEIQRAIANHLFQASIATR